MNERRSDPFLFLAFRGLEAECLLLGLAAFEALFSVLGSSPIAAERYVENGLCLAAVGAVAALATLPLSFFRRASLAGIAGAVSIYSIPVVLVAVPILRSASPAYLRLLIGVAAYGGGAFLCLRRMWRCDTALHRVAAIIVSSVLLSAIPAAMRQGVSWPVILAIGLGCVVAARGAIDVLGRLRIFSGRVRPATAMVAAAVLLVVFGPLDTPVSIASGGTPNVVLIVLDTVRVDHLSSYGYGRRTTPGIDGIAAEGTRFARAYANAPTTLPSHASLFTGLLPSQHGAHQEHEYLDGDLPTLAGMLSRAGYVTAGWSSNPNVGRERGLARGFEEFQEMWRLYEDTDRLTGLWLWQRIRYGGRPRPFDKGAAATTDQVLDWIAGVQKRQPFFLFINYLEAHSPYRPPREYVRRFEAEPGAIDPYRVPQPGYVAYYGGRAAPSAADFDAYRLLYDGAIAYMDQCVARVVSALRARGVLDDTLLIITSDHGESFGEHGLIGHQFSVYDNLLHVPLIIRFPPSFQSGTVDKQPVQLVDLLPTILDITGVSGPSRLAGHSLVRTPRPNSPIISEYFRPIKYLQMFATHGVEASRFDRRLKSVHADGFSYIWGSAGSGSCTTWAVIPRRQQILPDTVSRKRYASGLWSSPWPRHAPPERASRRPS